MFELKNSGIVRRASAQLLDIILLAVVTTGFMFLISLICDYSRQETLAKTYYTQWEDYRKAYVSEVAEYYGFVYTESDRGYTVKKDGKNSSLNEVMNALTASKGEDAQTKAAYDAYLALPSPQKCDWQYRYVYNLLFMMTSVGILLAYIVLDFIIPIIFKNGQTVGKKVFAICLVRPNCVAVTKLALFARTVVGKYAIETMFPVLMAFLFLFGGLGVLAIVLVAALLLLNVVLFFATKNKTPIHDVIAGTVAADMRVQMIFRSEEELAEKKALAARQAAEQAQS